MRLVTLRLVRFGPFSDRVLELSSEPGRIDLIYGANEAGKSTALRAISGLLFGIPRTTRDGHTHPMPELRLSGALRGADGRTLEIERLKRDKTSLLDKDGRPLDEKLLEQMLGGVSERVFAQTFGLDQVHLREGAQALLAGAGDIGESLFDAALGGQSVHKLLAELESEAETFFNPNTRAEKPRVNRAIRALKQRTSDLNLVVTGASAWHDQRERLASVTAALEENGARRSELGAERQRLLLVRDAAPLLADRARLVAELESLGPVPSLPLDARARRLEAEREREFLGREIAQLEQRLAERRQKRASLEAPSELSSFDAVLADELRDRIGSHKKAERDLPKRQGELRAVEADVQALVKRLGRREDADFGALELDAAARARLRKLELGYGRLTAERTAERRALADAEEKVGELEAELAGTAERRFDALEDAIADATRAGDPEGELSRVEKELARVERSATGSLARLGLASLSLESVLALELPGLETIERFESESAEADDAKSSVERERRDNEKRIADAEQELDALERSDVPSEEHLLAARARRESAWKRVIEARAEPAEFGVEAGKFEFTVREADEVSDRLRREEGRVRRRAEREAERERGLAERARLSAEFAEIETRRREIGVRWSDCWRSISIATVGSAGVLHARRPLGSPEEMRGWHARFSSTLGDVERVLSLRSERDSARGAVDRHRAMLAGVLGVPAEGASLDVLLERARKLLDAERRASSERASLERALEAAKSDRDKSARRLAEKSREHAEWASKWKAALEPLGLSAEATPEEVGAVLDAVDQLSAKLREADAKRAQIEGIERDARELDAHVRALVERHATDLADRALLEAAQALIERYDEAASNLKLRSALDDEIEAGQKSLDEARERLARADAELAVLMREAGVDELESLRAIEGRAERALGLKSELQRIEARLGEVREGRSIDTLEREIAGIDVRTARQRLEDLETDRASLEEERHELRQEIGDLEAGLERASTSKRAIEAEAEVQRHLAEARAGLERWARLTIASRLLRRQVERYRERHQGPVLERANRLFSTLTGGRFVGLRSDVDSLDRPSLRCVRSNGRFEDVAGLSEGTRDQLYLALRLATLEHYAADHEPLPLILDDVLMTFDDSRKRAALETLAETATRFQVLLFTHEASVVALARQTLGSKKAVIHDLENLDPPRIGTTLELFDQLR